MRLPSYEARAPLVATIGLVALLLLGWAIQESLKARADPLEMIALGAASPTLIVEGGQLHRLLANHLWHSGPVHLALNLAILLLAGLQVERRVGSAATLTLWTLGAVVGTGAWVLGGRGWLAIGASAANFALVGAWAGLTIRRREPVALPGLVTLALFVLPALLFPRAGLLSHAGGFLVGIVGVFAISRGRRDGDLLRAAGGISAVAILVALVAGLGSIAEPRRALADGRRLLEQPELPAPLAITIGASIASSDEASQEQLRAVRRALEKARDSLPEDDEAGFGELLEESLQAIDSRLRDDLGSP